MPSPVRAALLALSLFWLDAPAALADNDKAQWGLSIDVTRVNYREFSEQGRELNQETGVLPGLSLWHEGSRDSWFWRLSAGFHLGKVTYDGETQGGTPLKSDTDTGFIALSGRLGHWLGTPGTGTGLYLHLARQQWDRDILSTDISQGIYEQYRWTELGAGIKHVFAKPGSTHWGHALSVTGFATTQGDIFVQLSGLRGADFDDETLQLGDSTGGRITYTFSRVSNTGQTVRISPWLAWWEFARSNSREVTENGNSTGIFVTEPRSETLRFGVSVGLNF
jgi:hypothetical protein